MLIRERTTSIGGKIFKTTNSGNTWSEDTSAHNDNYLRSIFFTSISTGWVVGHGGLIMKTTNGGITFTGKSINVLPNKFSLYQNYPNPFNPVTNIKFAIPSNEFVTLKIYNILGKEVATLVNEKLNAGSYKVEWNAISYQSGVYFYKFITDEFVEVKKMIFIK